MTRSATWTFGDGELCVSKPHEEGVDEECILAGDLVEMLRSAGYLIYAPGAEADRARSDAEIARLAVAARRVNAEWFRAPTASVADYYEREHIHKRLVAAQNLSWDAIDARIAADDALVDATKAPATVERILAEDAS